MAESLCQTCKHTLTLSLPDKTIHVWADRGRLTRAIYNLIANAVRHTMEPSVISLRLIRTDTVAIIEVHDPAEPGSRICGTTHASEDERYLQIVGADAGFGFAIARAVAVDGDVVSNMAVRHRAHVRARTADDRDIIRFGLVSRCQSRRQSIRIAALRASCPVDGRIRIPLGVIKERQRVVGAVQSSKCLFQRIIRHTANRCHALVLHSAAEGHLECLKAHDARRTPLRNSG